MSLRKKIMLKIGVSLFILFSVIGIVTAYQFKNYGVKSANSEAKIVAQLVKAGLTAHMLEGTMNLRDYFLNQIRSLNSIKSIRVIRGKKVDELFGKGKDVERPKDMLDLKALETGKEQTKIIEDGDKILYRITIPYIATSKGNPNCLMCHTNAKEGDILGAITIVTDISSIKKASFTNLVNIALISFILFVGIGLYMYVFLGKYIRVFEELKDGMRKLVKGDFSKKIKISLNDEAGETVKEFNQFVEKIKVNFQEIKTVMKSLSQGDLTKRVERNMEGEFKEISDSINNSLNALSKLISLLKQDFLYLAENIQKISTELKNIFKDVEKQNASINEINDSLDIISERISSINQKINKVHYISSEVESNINDEWQNMEKIKTSMENLRKASQQVKYSVGQILSISERTNLLALNASIEAAKAGELGSGFTIVAEEIRKLAETTANFAKNIQSTVNNMVSLLNETSETVNKTYKGYSKVKSLYEELKVFLDSITEDIQKQTEALSEVSKNMERIAEISELNTQRNREIVNNAKDTLKLVSDVQKEVERFKTE